LLELDSDFGFLTLHGFAYRMNFNMGIKAGEVPLPGALGLLASAPPGCWLSADETRC